MPVPMTAARQTRPEAPEPIPALRPRPMTTTPLTGQPQGPKTPAPPTGTQTVPGGVLTATAPQTGEGTATLNPRAIPTTTTQVPPTAIPATVEPTQGTQQPLQPTTLTPTDPNNPLTAQTIGAGPGVDRFRVAQDQYQQFITGTDPAYQAALRDANRMGAAAGGLGSGQLRTSLGDLANTRGAAIGTERNRLFTDALLGSVDDARFATGVTQQQQGFQSDQQRQAFQNEMQRLGLTDQLTNSDFQRDLQTWLAGQQGGTGSGTAMQGANQAGNNSSDAITALQQWLAQRNARPGGVGGGTALPGTTYGGGVTRPPGSV